MIVVAPLSTLNFTWLRETFNTFPRLNVEILHGTKKQRLERLRAPADIYVINHDGIKVIERELADKNFDIWVFDELTAFKNNTAQRSKVAQRLSRNAKRVWGLTGTPMPKEPTDTFGQMRLITPDTSPRSFTHFRMATMTQVNQFLWVPKSGAKEQVYKLMQPAVRFSLEDCVDMPPQIEINREVTLGAKTKALYNELVNKLQVEIGHSQITAVNAGVLRNKLLQLSSGVVYDINQNGVVVDDSDRFNILTDLLDQTDRPALVFCPWRALVEHVHAKLIAAGYNVEMVYGGTAAKERLRIFSEIQRPNSTLNAVVAHPGTMSHGLNLHGADTVIWYALIDSLETYLQANARIHRPGQEATHTRVCHLYGTKLEGIVMGRLRSRQSMQDALLELFEA
jgi:SNF2 family DNA or RNA helicase